MNLRIFAACICFLACTLTAQGQTPVYKTIEWSALMPEYWVKALTKDFDALYKLSNLQDGSSQSKSGTHTAFKKLPESMDMVWIEGELKESRVPTAQGMSGYAVLATSVVPYDNKGLQK